MGIKLDTDIRLPQPNEPKEESKLKQETLVPRKMFSRTETVHSSNLCRLLTCTVALLGIQTLAGLAPGYCLPSMETAGSPVTKKDRGRV